MVMYKTVGCLANCDFHFLYVTFISKLHINSSRLSER
ncbi:hypothetical protein LSH36_1437g00022 [Paralvinella palmiformis]|uniref:Uncharacterized protein n=1 Tax=Paralvinella palmiformis TaxID=53620 RepID=A0AAD9MN62_9ANNE|nr:hypothetical protein LSH36_1437g00022 [Paralvinella palmiformis]